MAVKVSYDQDCRMTITGVDCHCGCEHHAIDKDIYIGKDLLPRIPEYIRKRGLGTNCVLVADDTTYRVAGSVEIETLAETLDVKLQMGTLSSRFRNTCAS